MDKLTNYLTGVRNYSTGRTLYA